jgi:3-hydroxyacyl-CoA dehydrogenase
MKLGKRIAKVPVLVGVCDGFVGNRMLAKRAEGFFCSRKAHCRAKSIAFCTISAFPWGRSRWGDLAGLDVGWRNRKAKLDHLTPREQACNLIDKICGLGRYGQRPAPASTSTTTSATPALIR